MSCAPLCNVPRAGGGRTLVPMTSQAGHRQLLYAPEDAVSAAIDVRVPRAERGTDVPACAGCPGIVDCARGFIRLTPGPAATWDPSEQKSSTVLPCKQPWSELGGKSTGTPVSDARGRVLVLREVHDLIGNEPCQAVLRGFFCCPHPWDAPCPFQSHPFRDPHARGAGDPWQGMLLGLCVLCP